MSTRTRRQYYRIALYLVQIASHLAVVFRSVTCLNSAETQNHMHCCHACVITIIIRYRRPSDRQERLLGDAHWNASRLPFVEHDQNHPRSKAHNRYIFRALILEMKSQRKENTESFETNLGHGFGNLKNVGDQQYYVLVENKMFDRRLELQSKRKL